MEIWSSEVAHVISNVQASGNAGTRHNASFCELATLPTVHCWISNSRLDTSSAPCLAARFFSTTTTASCGGKHPLYSPARALVLTIPFSLLRVVDLGCVKG